MSFYVRYLFFVYCAIWLSITITYAQSKVIPLSVKSADALQGFQKEGDSSYQKLIGNVQLEHQGTLMYCDSAIINLVLNDAEAFGDVLIVQPDGTTISSDYVKYAGDKKLAIFRSNVTLTDGKNSLWTDSLDYQTQAKIGTYTTGGTLQAESTTLSSEKGQYLVKTKDAIFEGDVVVSDPQYNCTSKKIAYNTQTKLIKILEQSKVVNASSILISSNGVYDAKNEVGKFYGRSSAQNKEQYIEADTLEYNKKTNWSIAKGKVIAKDTAQHITLYAGWASYQESVQKMIAYIRPVMKIEQEQDSFFLSADTFLIAPIKPIIIDKKKNPFKYERKDAWTDIAVFHPSTDYINNRPNWLFKNENKNVSITLNDIQLEFPVLVLAYKKGEDINLAVPIDIIEVLNKKENCNLGLKKGVYEIVITNRKESFKFEHKVK